MTTPPKARPAVAMVSLIWAALLVAVGVVALHDLASTRDWTTTGPWVSGVLDALDGLEATDLLVAVAVLVGLIGLWLVYLALKPARRTHLPVDRDDIDLWVSSNAAVAMACDAADRTAGVLSAHAHGGRRRIDVDVRTNDDPRHVHTAVLESVTAQLQGVYAAPINVRCKGAAS